MFWGVRSQAKQDLLQRLDAENYSSDDLVILTLPIALPYPIQQNGFERVNGEFEFNGEFYNLVKQRLENDTLFMVCIKDHQEKKLFSAMSDFTDLTNSLPAGAKHTMDLFGKLFKDYTSSLITCVSSGDGWTADITFPSEVSEVLQLNYPILSPPPEV